MIPFNQDATGGKELSPEQCHATYQNPAGNFEFSTQKSLTEFELNSIARIKQILDKLQFNEED